MYAGTLRHRIRIETPIETDNGSGGTTGAWGLLAETRAAITPLSGRALAQAAAIEDATTHTVSIRYRTGITTSCRIVYGSRVFRITSPPRDVEELHRELVIDCAEVLPEVGS